MPRAVILDNSAIARGLLRTILVDGGHQVVGESSVASSTPSRVARLTPQLVFISLDAVDPDLQSTVEALRIDLPKALIFGMSAAFTPEMLKRAVEQGANGFIVKPFNGAAVLSAIRSAVLRLVKEQAAVPKN